MKFKDAKKGKPKNDDLCLIIEDGEPSLAGWNKELGAWFDDDDGEHDPDWFMEIAIPE